MVSKHTDGLKVIGRVAINRGARPLTSVEVRIDPATSAGDVARYLRGLARRIENGIVTWSDEDP